MKPVFSLVIFCAARGASQPDLLIRRTTPLVPGTGGTAGCRAQDWDTAPDVPAPHGTTGLVDTGCRVSGFVRLCFRPSSFSQHGLF